MGRHSRVGMALRLGLIAKAGAARPGRRRRTIHATGGKGGGRLMRLPFSLPSRPMTIRILQRCQGPFGTRRSPCATARSRRPVGQPVCRMRNESIVVNDGKLGFNHLTF
jgi:hypothetical protein